MSRGKNVSAFKLLNHWAPRGVWHRMVGCEQQNLTCHVQGKRVHTPAEGGELQYPNSTLRKSQTGDKQKYRATTAAPSDNT